MSAPPPGDRRANRDLREAPGGGATILFEETQRFRQRWLLALVFWLVAVALAVGVWALVQQVVLGKPFGNNPLSDDGVLIMSGTLFFVAILIAWLFLAASLTTLVTTEGLFVRFRPFHRKLKRLGPEGLVRWEARTYRPLREFGGWGVRYGVGGKAYNVSGNEGVQLTYSDGSPVLIGSQRAKELERAIEAMMNPRAQGFS